MGSGQASGQYAFMAYVASDDELREAGRDAEERIDKYLVDLSFREDLYAAIKAFADRGEALGPDEQRLLDFELRDYRRNGFELPEAERARVRELSDELVSLGVEFQKNVSEWDDGILVSRDELEGLPDAVRRLAADGGGRRGDALPGVAGLPGVLPVHGEGAVVGAAASAVREGAGEGRRRERGGARAGAGGAPGGGGAARVRLVGRRTRTRCACRRSGSGWRRSWRTCASG